MKKLILFVVLFFGTLLCVTGQCQRERFLAATDETTESGLQFAQAVDQNPLLIRDWKLLDDLRSNSYLKNDVDRLKIFHKLSSENKALIAQFTDVNANSTLAKFIDDCDDEFLEIINKAENHKFVQGFVAHKSDSEIDEIVEFLSSLKAKNQDVSKITKWIERSENATRFRARKTLGNDFEKANTADILADKGPAISMGGNGSKKPYSQLQVGDPKVILDDALVEPIPIGTTGRNNSKKIYAARYHDSKLTDAAPWTTNQKSEIIEKFRNNEGSIDLDGRQYLDFEVRNTDDTLSKKATDGDFSNFLQRGDKIRVYKDDIYKSISNGDGVLLETKKIFNNE